MDKALGIQMSELWCMPQGFYSQMREDDQNYIVSKKISAKIDICIWSLGTQKKDISP